MSGAEHQLAIVGGEVVDGTGGARQRLDVGIDGGRITALRRGGVTAATTIDAAGKIVAPGFIDLHSHADFTIQGSPQAETQLRQGVTTLLTGNCGLSPFPLDAAQTVRTESFGAAELSWDWVDAAGYAAAVSRERLGINIALQVGHNAIRRAVLGTAGRRGDAHEIEAMCRLIDSAADAGVFGFSTGLVYEPGIYADSDEINALVAHAAQRGLLYSTHMRNESHQLVAAVQEALATAQQGNARLQISHLKAMGRPNHGSIGQVLALIDAARARGLDVAMDVYPYTASSTTLTSQLSAWARADGRQAMLTRLAEADTRAQIHAELDARFAAGLADPRDIVIAAVSEPVAAVLSEDREPAAGPRSADEGDAAGCTVVGRSLSDLAAASATTPPTALIDLLLRYGGNVAIVNHAMSEQDLVAVLQHPMAAVASDGANLQARGNGRPHPRSFGTYARVLGRYVREQHVLTLEQAVHKMTALPASRLQMRDRGVLRLGAHADVVVFDPATVIDRATYDDPWQLADGVSATVVAGVVALCDGQLTGELGGVVLRRDAGTRISDSGAS